jgi:trehalose 6-phosphate phosphatase
MTAASTDRFSPLLPPPPPLSPEAALFLDFDGTLVDLAATPDAVAIDRELNDLLARLVLRQGGRVALVSGRSIAQLEGFLGAAASGAALIESMTLVGSHGAEIRLAGAAPVAPPRPEALDRATAHFTEMFRDRAGVVIEVKTLGVAVHYRQAVDAAELAEAEVDAFAMAHGLAVQRGKMMVELRLPGHDKGASIAKLMTARPFAGHPPVFLGDDLTDEPGFVVALAEGGMGVLVGPPRASAARYGLAHVAAVRAWLGQDLLGGTP